MSERDGNLVHYHDKDPPSLSIIKQGVLGIKVMWQSLPRSHRVQLVSPARELK